MLSPLVAHSQIYDTEGAWQGSVTCGELQVASNRAGRAFTSPVAVSVSRGAMTGKRENAQVIELFTGSIERSGRASFEGNGHWKDDPKRSWRYRLRGTQSGSHMMLTGPMESQDGKIKLRDCQLKLGNAAMERKVQSAVTKPAPASNKTAVNPVSATESAARATEKLNKDKELAARQAAEKRLEAERASGTKRQSDEAAAAAVKANVAELEALRLKNLQLESAKVAAERAAADKAVADKAAAQKADSEAKKAPIKARSAMDL